MALMQVSRPNRVRHMLMGTYEDNYGFSMNYYQPMIDYLDAKQTGGRQLDLPHLPWSNERGLKKYRPSNSVQRYTSSEVLRLSRAAADRANQVLLQSRQSIRTPFSVKKLADASRVTKHIVEDSIIERSQRRRLERQAELEDLIRRDTGRLLQRLRAMEDIRDVEISADLKRAIRGKSASAITAALLADSEKNMKTAKRQEEDFMAQAISNSVRGKSENRLLHATHIEFTDERMIDNLDYKVSSSLCNMKRQLSTLNQKTVEMYSDSSKQTSIEIEQLSARVVEAETRLKTEVQRIKKKLQIQITELEMSLDVSNKTNIDLQKVIKKQSLQLTEIQAHYDEIQRQLQQTLDQYTVAQRRIQTLSGELEEMRGGLESAQRAKRNVELQYEEAQTRISELSSVNVNLASIKSRLEQELSVVASDYEEVTKELRISDERYQKVQVELKHTMEELHIEQERIVKIETIKKSLEVEVKNLSIRLEEVELNAVAGSKRIISKLEARIRDLELELEEEKRRHAETIKILRKKERTVKEVMIQCEEDQKNIILLQEALDKSTAKINLFKRQLNEQEGMSQQTVTRVRRFQRELEAAEDRAECAESNLNMIRAKHRTFVTTSTVPGSVQYLVQETRTITE
ncbi:paramyosin, short form isoform X2 [Eupeodes corollae]|uniref:paramyosin, short form isoform X2 n=1 Tax=Eupeodes corollae TaxID=290404 RepID=UPI002493BEEB|nr:paramyosin, short form isoform X2 [Eupeodes corollae]